MGPDGAQRPLPSDILFVPVDHKSSYFARCCCPIRNPGCCILIFAALDGRQGFRGLLMLGALESTPIEARIKLPV